MTIRNWNTTVKLFDLMRRVEERLTLSRSGRAIDESGPSVNRPW